MEGSEVKDDPDITSAAKAMSKLGASKGGHARAAVLTPEERQQIAREAVTARWERRAEAQAYSPGTALPKETHRGILKIFDREIPCANLDNSLRVFSGPGVSRVFGSRKVGVNARASERTSNLPQLPPFLTAANLQKFIPDDVMNSLMTRIQYKSKRGPVVWGFEAGLLPRICEAIVAAAQAGALHARQKYLIDTAQILRDGFANVGIIALVDEATGFQEDRDRDNLRRLLEAYISKELLPWAKTFPDEYFQEMFRLKGWKYHAITKRGPRKAGQLTKQIVYEKLPPGVKQALEERNPVVKNWRRKYRHPQLMTEDIGQAHLKNHLIAVTTLMRASHTWKGFEILLERAFPSKSLQLEMELVE
jgi:P63C domain